MNSEKALQTKLEKLQAKLNAARGALKKITMYDQPERLHKRAEKSYGLTGEEAIEMAYENVLNEARIGLAASK